MLHHFEELVALAIVQRKDDALEFRIKRVGLRLVVGRGGVAGAPARVSNGPAGHSLDVALDPPAIQDAQAGNAVERRLHAAGAGSLQRKLRRVEPQIHTGSHFPTQFEVVIIQKHNGNIFPQRFFRLVNTANDVFAARVIGVRFAGKNNLKMASIFRNLAQAIEVGQDEVGALVAGGAACEANRKYLRIQMEARFRTDQFKQFVLGDQMRRPKILCG